MSDLIRTIVSNIGGEIYDGGTKAICPGPGHSSSDRSMSLWHTPHGKLLVKSFADDTYAACMRHIRACAPAADAALKQPKKKRTREDHVTTLRKQTAATQIFNNSRPIANTRAEGYLLGRAIPQTLISSANLFYNHSTPHYPYGSKYPNPPKSPAMIAPIMRPNDTIMGIHITYLDLARDKPGRFSPLRKIAGNVKYGAIRLHDHIDTLVVGQGIETVLSTSHYYSEPGWVIGAHGYTSWQPPEDVTTLIVACENSTKEIALTEKARKRFEKLGKTVIISKPPAEFSDLNDFHMHQSASNTKLAQSGR